GINYRHRENAFNDFSRQVLLPQEQSTQGPAFAKGDVNGDGLEDIYLGAALNQSGVLYLQNANGKFDEQKQPALESDKDYEDNGAHFFDADGDGDLDLYIASGGYELMENDALLQDRLYINDGKGNFTRSNALPKMLSSTKAVHSYDFDNDCDLVQVCSVRVVPVNYLVEYCLAHSALTLGR